MDNTKTMREGESPVPTVGCFFFFFIDHKHMPFFTKMVIWLVVTMNTSNRKKTLVYGCYGCVLGTRADLKAVGEVHLVVRNFQVESSRRFWLFRCSCKMYHAKYAILKLEWITGYSFQDMLFKHDDPGF